MSDSLITPNATWSASPPLDARSLELRQRIVQTLETSKRGHVGSAFSLVEIIRVLYDDILRYDSQIPKWPERDRFILSKGHGCLALYMLLAEKGFFPDSELSKVCLSDGILGGHPDFKVPGVEASTGSLGHGLSIGVGFALNEKYEKTGYRTMVLIGDGESNEGAVWEAAMSAGKHRLASLTVIVDYNKLQSYGTTLEIQDMEPMADKWRAFGWAVAEVDGHSVDQLRSVLGALPIEQDRPSAVICHTVKGKGIPFAESNADWHHKNRITPEEIDQLQAALKVANA